MVGGSLSAVRAVEPPNSKPSVRYPRQEALQGLPSCLVVLVYSLPLPAGELAVAIACAEALLVLVRLDVAAGVYPRLGLVMAHEAELERLEHAVADPGHLAAT